MHVRQRWFDEFVHNYKFSLKLGHSIAHTTFSSLNLIQNNQEFIQIPEAIFTDQNKKLVLSLT